MKTIFLVAVCCLVSVAASAQTGTPTSYTLKTYQAGTATVALAPLTVSVAQLACNQDAPSTTSTENPTRWSWADPVNAGKVCIYTDTRLATLADGAYEGTASAANADGSSAETARVPFTRRRPNPPAAPGGLRITP